MAKALGVHIKDFWNNHWPVGMFVEDNEESLFDQETGAPILEDNEKYDLSRFGYLLYEDASKGEGGIFATYFNRWYKTKTTATIIITVPREMAQGIADKIALENPQAKVQIS